MWATVLADDISGAQGGIIGAVATVIIGGFAMLIDRYFRAKSGAEVSVLDAEQRAEEARQRRADDAAEAERKRTEDDRKVEDERRRRESAEEKAKRRDIIAELREANEMLRTQGKEDRETVHTLRNEAQNLSVRLAVCEAAVAACQRERDELRGMVDSMAAALAEHGILVILPGDHHPQAPADGGSGQ
jgi:hypothetical protein